MFIDQFGAADGVPDITFLKVDREVGKIQLNFRITAIGQHNLPADQIWQTKNGL